MAAEEGNNLREMADGEASNAMCQLCEKTVYKYVCPRCNIFYCSVACYQSPAHSDCSEVFYKENIQEWLKVEDVDQESERSMIDILKRVENQEDVDYQSNDDSDDELSLTERLAGIDVNDADEVWDRLLPEEQQEFMDMINNGDVSQLIPEWKPWWATKFPTPKVRFLDDPTEPEYKSLCPKIKNVPEFSSMSKAEPSPMVHNNVVNVLASYAITARYFNGDFDEMPMEAASTIINVSKNLSKNEIFSDFKLAIESTNQAVMDCPWIILEADAHRSSMLTEDVQNILGGPNEENRLYYAKAALSDIMSLFYLAKKAEKRVTKGKFSSTFPEPSADAVPHVSKDLLMKCAKKLKYYLSWSDSYLLKNRSE